MRINEIAREIHQIAREKGFYENERNLGEMLMLVVSELGEALEAHRKGAALTSDDYDAYEFEKLTAKNIEETPVGRLRLQNAFKDHIKDSLEDEIADAIIRLFDLGVYLNMNLEWHIQEKMNYNRTREKKHGKAY